MDKMIQISQELLERASNLVGNPGTNISGSTDIACQQWQKDYEIFLRCHDPKDKASIKNMIELDRNNKESLNSHISNGD